MKRITGLTLVIVGIAAGALLIGPLWSSSGVTQDTLGIPIRAVKITDSTNIEVGAPCDFPGDMDSVFSPPKQVIVKDETGTVVAIEDLDGGTWEPPDDGADELWCIIDRDVPVPDAAFYSVSVDGAYVRSFDRQDLPLTGDDRLIYQIVVGE